MRRLFWRMAVILSFIGSALAWSGLSQAACTINPTNPTVTAGGSVTWSATNITGLNGPSNRYSYSWSFTGTSNPTPTSSTSPTPTVTYPQAGTATTNLTIRGQGNTSTTCTRQFTVQPAAQVPSISINDVSVNEGQTANFTVSLSAASTQTVTVVANTANGSAVAPGDYTARANVTLTFNPGVTTQTFAVQTIDDTLSEGAETFVVNLSNPTNATIADAQGVATIAASDQQLPTLSINDVTVTEGATASFTISLSATSTQQVTVLASTADGTATAGQDYTARTNVTVTFPAGTTTQTFTVATIDDAANEGAETFFVNLSSPTNATIADAQGVATIPANDAPTPSLSINDVTVTEGQPAVFTVTLSQAATGTVTVNYATANGTAGLSDYTAASGTLSFPAGTTTRTISVTTINDSAVEQTETFFVNLTAAVGATIADGQGIGTIIDNDAQVPNTSINSTSQSSLGRVTSVVPQQTQVPNSTHSVLAINDLGMHCGDLDTRISSILPPFQVLLGQIIQKGAIPVLNPPGFTLTYSAVANANDPILTQAGVITGVMDDGRTYKTNFWDFPIVGFAYDPFYPGGLGITPLETGAFTVTADEGLPVPNVEEFYIGPDGLVDRCKVPTAVSTVCDGTLTAVQHNMPGIQNPYVVNAPQLVKEHYGDKPFFLNFPFGYVANDVNWFEGAGPPFAAFDDFGRENAYPLVRVQARNAANTVVSTVDTVLPISGEASCSNCHADPLDPNNLNSRSSSPTDALRTAGLPVAESTQDPDANMPARVSLEWAADINVLRLHDLRHGARYVSTACDGVPAGENCLTQTGVATPCDIKTNGGLGGSTCLTNKALVQNQPIVCQVCHYTPALDLAQVGPKAGAVGTEGNGRNQMAHQSNSRVMHNHHGEFTTLFPPIPAPIQQTNGTITNQATRLAALENSCYQCHPGTTTKCLRGAMFNGGMLCNDCHGTMAQVGNDFSRNVSPSSAGSFTLARDFYTNPATPRVPWANEPGCGSCHTGDARNNLFTTNGTVGSTANLVINTRDSNGRRDGLRLRQAFRTGDAKATPIVPTNKRFAEPAVPATFNGFANPGAGNPKLYRVSTGHGGVMCEGCHGATHAEWPNANPNANDNLVANQLQGHVGTITDCDTCHNTTNPGNNLNGPHGLHPIDFTSTPWSSASNHRTLGSNYTANCAACHGGTSRDQSCGTPLSRAINTRTLSGRTVARGQPVGCAVCHNGNYWTSTCLTQ